MRTTAAGGKRPHPAEKLPQAIKGAAWRQIAAGGAAALSLRAVARALGITAPAIYNYFRRRDELVTALIVDAYTAFGASQQAAGRKTASADFAGRLTALGLAYRDWATANPQRYQLMFAAPFPGYRLPAQVVGPVAGRALSVLVGVLEQARREGKLRLRQREQTSGVSAPAEALYGSADPRVLRAAVSVWARVHGLVAIELGRQYPPFVSDPQRLYRRELEALVGSIIKESEED
jgi:AcrR family transcriptional regulator